MSLPLVEIVTPFAEDFGNEFRIALSDDHCRFPIVGFVHVLPEEGFERVLEFVFCFDDFLPEEVRNLLASFVHVLPP